MPRQFQKCLGSCGNSRHFRKCLISPIPCDTYNYNKNRFCNAQLSKYYFCLTYLTLFLVLIISSYFCHVKFYFFDISPSITKLIAPEICERSDSAALNDNFC